MHQALQHLLMLTTSAVGQTYTVNFTKSHATLVLVCRVHASMAACGIALEALSPRARHGDHAARGACEPKGHHAAVSTGSCPTSSHTSITVTGTE